jgi:D-amino-acid dehydrogenase
VENQAVALGNLLRDSVGAYQPLVINAGAQSLLRKDGHLFVYPERSDFEADALAWKLRRDNGIAYAVLEDQNLWDREPALSHSYRLGVFLADNGHTTNPSRLINMLAQAFRRDGGKIVKAAAKSFEFDAERLVGVATDTGVLPCDFAVVAAGAHSKQFTTELGDNIPVDTERGYHIVLPSWGNGPRIPIMDTSGKFVATPMEEGLRLAGTVEFAGLKAKPDWKRAQKLLTLGQRLFPCLSHPDPEQKPEMWMGFRPSMPDSLPVIGHSRRSRNIVYAFGHGHVGVAGGATTGLLVSDLIAGRPTRIPSEPFSARRF